MMLSCKKIIARQLAENIKGWKGQVPDKDIGTLRPVKGYEERAKAWLDAAGGCPKSQELMAQWKSNRGKNLLKRGGPTG